MIDGERVTELSTRLRDEIDSSAWGTGYQYAVWLNGFQVATDAYGVDGVDVPFDSDTMCSVYCAGKPLIALLVAMLCDTGELSWNDRLGDVVEMDLIEELKPLTVEQVASHTAGLSPGGSLDLLIADWRRRRVSVCQSKPVSPVGSLRYSEAFGFELLGLVIEGAANVAVDVALRQRVLQRLDIEAVFGSASPRTVGRNIAVNADVTSLPPTPLLWEVSDDNLADIRPASGVAISMASLARFYQILLDGLADKHPVVSPNLVESLISPIALPQFDPNLGRRCRFGRGLMIELADHGFSAHHSRRSFGHSGVHGMTVGAADGETGLAYAIHVNGVTREIRASYEFAANPALRRTWMIDAIHRAALLVR